MKLISFEVAGQPGYGVVETGGPAALELTTRLDGSVMQESRIDQLIDPIPERIAYISQ
ncbi:MAG: hypothetical protein IID55_13995 [Proteobacteria bacterium]|nr:hypothetical protein [Pseudomonadota bacterium]